MKNLNNIFLKKEYSLILAELIKNNHTQIRDFIKQRINNKQGNDFEFFEFHEGFYVISKKIKNNDKLVADITFNLGFPFPVLSTKQKAINKKYNFNFYFKGEVLRLKQRELLKKKFGQDKSTMAWLDVNDSVYFRKVFHKAMTGAAGDRLLYVDPYSFIGDAFIGMHFIDGLIKKYNFSDRIIFSKSANNLGFLGEAYAFDEEHIKSLFASYKCLVFPDLLDINFETTITLISSLSGLNGVLVFPGRSLFVVLKSKKTFFYHLNQPDTILKDQNIEDYMDECLQPFIDKSESYQESKFIGDKKSFFINPFGSLDNKTLDLNFVIDLCKKLDSQPGVKIHLIGGLRKCSFQSRWVENFIKSGVMNLVDCKLSYYATIDQLALDIYKLKPGVILTADTSIAHLANRLNIPVAVICHTARFDNSSVQSMISESPLGFGRYFKNNFPLLIKSYNPQHPGLVALLLNLIVGNYHGNKKDQVIKKLEKNMNSLFDELYFYNRLMPQLQGKVKKILKKLALNNKLKHL